MAYAHFKFEQITSCAQQFSEICVVNGRFVKAAAKVSFFERIVHWLKNFESASEKNLDVRRIFYVTIREMFGLSISEKIRHQNIFDIHSKKPLSDREITHVKNFLSSEKALLIREKQCRRQQAYLIKYTNKLEELQEISKAPHRSLWSHIKHPDILQSIEEYTKIVEIIDLEDQKGLLQLGMLIGHK